MMRTDVQTVTTGWRLAAAAGVAVAVAGVSSPAISREAPTRLCPNAPFANCEPTPAAAPGRAAFAQTGKASWYGADFHGRKTASGDRFDQHALTAAHRTLPLGTKVKVTNLETGRTVLVRINDRGPYINGRIIDLSKRAASALGMEEAGVAPVKVETVNGERPGERATAERGKTREADRDVEVAEQPDQR